MLPIWCYELVVGTVGLGWRSFSVKGICGYSNTTFRGGIWIRKSKIYFHDTSQIWHPHKEKLVKRKNVGGDFLFFIEEVQ